MIQFRELLEASNKHFYFLRHIKPKEPFQQTDHEQKLKVLFPWDAKAKPMKFIIVQYIISLTQWIHECRFSY